MCKKYIHRSAGNPIVSYGGLKIPNKNDALKLPSSAHFATVREKHIVDGSFGFKSSAIDSTWSGDSEVDDVIREARRASFVVGEANVCKNIKYHDMIDVSH